MRWLIATMAFCACAAKTPCETCDAGCGGGLVTSGLVLTPPGCGSQCTTQFCPGGCSGVSCLDHSHGPDGGLSDCRASSTSTGAFAAMRGGLIVIAPTRAEACDGGTLIIDFPAGMAGTVEVSTRAQLATKVGTRATSGSVSVTLDQPGGGRIGTYALQFPDGDESADFVAPECDVCGQ